MLITEITGSMTEFVAVLRVDGMVCRVAIEAGSLLEVRRLLAHLYGAANVLSVRQSVNEADENGTEKPKQRPFVLPTIKPHSGIKKNKPTIKPMTPAQYNKYSEKELKRSTKAHEKKTKAMVSFKKASDRLNKINQVPGMPI